MGTNVIEIEGLRKEYRGRRGRRVAAIDGLDLAIAEGGIFGFLGPNGSGKTTTIRCLLGLVRPTGGRLRLFGQSLPRALPGALRRIGSIVETPALFPTLSGRDNLRLLGAIDRVGPVLPTTCSARSGSPIVRGISSRRTRSACANVSRSRRRCSRIPPC